MTQGQLRSSVMVILSDRGERAAMRVVGDEGDGGGSDNDGSERGA